VSRYPDAIERIEDQGFVAELHYDTDPQSPKEWDQAGILATWHRRYCFDVNGEKEFGTGDDFIAAAKKGRWVYLLVGMYDHSGISLYEGGGSHAFDAQGWDSGTVGVIYTTWERYSKMCDSRRKGWRKRAEETLRSELRTWDMFVQGQVYGYTITGPDGEVGDSCWGFYGYEDAMQEMKDALRYTLEAERKAEEMVKQTFAL
jgi:hypothetical protein